MIGVPYNPDVTIFLLSQSLNASQFNPNVPDAGNFTVHNLLFDTAAKTLIWVDTATNLIVQETAAGGGGGVAVILEGAGTGSSYRCGNSNVSPGNHSTVSGGTFNNGNGNCSTISGGYGNGAFNVFSTVRGGYGNLAFGCRGYI